MDRSFPNAMGRQDFFAVVAEANFFFLFFSRLDCFLQNLLGPLPKGWMVAPLITADGNDFRNELDKMTEITEHLPCMWLKSGYDIISCGCFSDQNRRQSNNSMQQRHWISVWTFCTIIVLVHWRHCYEWLGGGIRRTHYHVLEPSLKL